MGLFDFVGDIFSDVAGPIISAGSALFGGSESRSQQEQLFDEQLTFQDKLSREGIQRRVADAEAAGIHPLYSIGANTYNAPGVPIGGDQLGPSIAKAGADIGGAVSRLSDKGGKRFKELKLKLLEAQIGETDARKGLLQSQAQTNRQNAGGLGVISEVPGTPVPKGHVSIGKLKEVIPGQDPITPGEGLIDLQATPQKTRKTKRPGVLAGEHQGYQEFILPGGLPIQLPASEEGALAEVMEAVPWYMWPGIIAYNKNFYRDPWLTDFRDFALWGKESKNVYPRAKSYKKSQTYKKGDKFWKQGKDWFNKMLPSFKK